MSSSPLRPITFPQVIESDDANEPPLIWCGHISIVIVPRKEADGARREEAAPRSEG